MMATAEVKPGAVPDETRPLAERRTLESAEAERRAEGRAEGRNRTRRAGGEVRWWDFFRVPHA